MKEQRKHRAAWSIILFSWIVFAGAALVFSLDFSKPDSSVVYGVTFSHKYARWPLQLNWREAYVTMLNDIDFSEVRLMTYWDLIEEKRGHKDYHEIDFLMDTAQEHGVHVTLTVGQRQPRWPECHKPAWAQELSTEELQAELLNFIQETVLRYKDHPALSYWQVENEPLLEFFGECDPLDTEFFKKEIALVKSLDSEHPVMTTASGEFDSWKEAAQYTDILGVSLYKVIAKRFIGTIYYPIPPAFYYWRAHFNSNHAQIFISELQGEPWTTGDLTQLSARDASRQINSEQLKENVNFARSTGFDRIWVWGVEWWYWLKVKQNRPELWQAAQEIFGVPK